MHDISDYIKWVARGYSIGSGAYAGADVLYVEDDQAMRESAVELMEGYFKKVDTAI